MVACQACHRAKVKCQNDNGKWPCRRCIRLGCDCQPHVSRQGMGRSNPKVPRRKQQQGGKGNTNNNDDGLLVASAKHPTELQLAKYAKESLGPNHFGLHHMLRQWMAFAITRRSFVLLSKACNLAHHCGINMDDLCSGLSSHPNGSHVGVDFLSHKLHVSKAKQVVSGPPLRLDEVPLPLREATNVVAPSASSSLLLGTRLFVVRQVCKGMSRFYVSPQFAADVADWETINATWQANEQEIKDLWLPAEEKSKYADCMIRSIFCLKEAPKDDDPLTNRMILTKASNTKLRFKSGIIVKSNFFYGYYLQDIDDGFSHMEYIPLEEPSSVGGGSSSNNTTTSLTTSSNMSISTIQPLIPCPGPPRPCAQNVLSSSSLAAPEAVGLAVNNNDARKQDQQQQQQHLPPRKRHRKKKSTNSNRTDVEVSVLPMDNFEEFEMTAPLSTWIAVLESL